MTMTWTKGLAAAALAVSLAAGCSERKADNQGERAAATTDRAAERTEGALERGGEKVAGAGRDVAQGAREAGREIAGTVKRVTNDALEVGDREIRIGEDTQFYRDGVRIERDDVRPGDEIRAAFDEMGDELKAKRVEVQRKAD